MLKMAPNEKSELVQLMRVFSFTEADLAANMEGRLSRQQNKWFKQETIRIEKERNEWDFLFQVFAIGIFVFVVPILLASKLYLCIAITLVVFAGAGLALLDLTDQQKPAQEDAQFKEVATASGIAEKVERENPLTFQERGAKTLLSLANSPKDKRVLAPSPDPAKIFFTWFLTGSIRDIEDDHQYMIVENHLFQVSPEQLQVIKPFKPYCVYFLPATEVILSIRPLPIVDDNPFEN